MRKIINGEPHVIKHKCDPERMGKIMTEEELHEFAVDSLIEEYNMSGNNAGKLFAGDPSAADLCLFNKGTTINIKVVYSNSIEIDPSVVDTAWMIERYRTYGEIPRLTIASAWCFDSKDGHPAICGGSFCFKYYNISLIPDQENPPLPDILHPFKLASKYAEAWRQYSADIIEPYLDKDFHYHSDWVFDEMPSRYEYINYFRGKLEAVRKANNISNVQAAIDCNSGQAGVILYQEGINPTIILLGVKDGRITSAEMKEYVPTPDEEESASSQEQPEPIDQVHGDHIDAIMPTDRFLKEYISGIIQEGILYRKTETEATLEDMEKTKTDVMSIRYGNQRTSMLSLIAANRKTGTNNFVTTYPMLEGRNYDVIIDRVHVWDNQLEATVECHLEGFDFAFFATDYYVNKALYVPGSSLSISFAALGLHVEEAQRGFSFEGQQAVDFLAKTGDKPEYDKDGNVMPLHFSLENLVCYLRTRSKSPDEGEFQSPVHKNVELSRDFLDVPFKCSVISICNSLDDFEFFVPLYYRADLLPDVKKNDPIRGWLWLTGEITGKHHSMDETVLYTSNAFGAKASAFANYLRDIDTYDRDNVDFILNQLPALKMDEGYMLDLFNCGDRHGSVHQLYACRVGATETWHPEPEKVMEQKRANGIFWNVFKKEGEKEKTIVPYRDDLYVDGLMPYSYAKMVPSVFTHLTVPFDEKGVTEAWLLHMAEYFLPRFWHANYGTSDYIFSPERVDVIIGRLKEENRNGSKDAVEALKGIDRSKLLPSVRLEGETAYVTFSYWNDWKGLVTETEEIRRDGKTVSFQEGSKTVLVKYDCGILY